MALKKQLRDKDGNLIYPDVGIDLDEVIYGSDPGEVSAPVAWIETADIKDGQITSAKVADGAITTDKVADSAIATGKVADSAITTAKINSNAVTNAKIDWNTTARPIYYTGTNWATSWTFKYYQQRPQLIFVAWQSSTALFCRIYDQIYKVYQNGGSTITATIDATNRQWTITVSNTGVLTVLEMNNIQAS